MGLDLVASDDETCHYAGYSGVHRFRFSMIQAFVTALRALPPEPGEDETLEDAAARQENEADQIARWCNREVCAWIDYDRLSKKMAPFTEDARYQSAMAGLWKLVYHSDCEGGHTAGDCLDIDQCFKFCEAEFRKLPDDAYGEQEQIKFTRLSSFFNHAATHDLSVSYH